MANPINWPGKSGRQYQFEIHDISASFNDVTGNYIFTRWTNNAWQAIYIGEGKIKDRVADHINKGCVTKKGATHIHAHVNNNQQARFNEETDLLALHVEAYVPLGCNIKEGG